MNTSAAFAKVFAQIKKRMEVFTAPQIETMDADAIRQESKKIRKIAV